MPHLQLKDIPAGLHEAIRARAEVAGISMREYVLRLIEADLGSVDSHAEMRARLARLPRARAGDPAVEVLAGARADRDRELLGRVHPR